MRFPIPPLFLVMLFAFASCGTGAGVKKPDDPEPLPEHIKKQEKGLTESRDQSKHTKTKKLAKPTKAEIRDFQRIWNLYAKGDSRWPLERDRFKKRSEGAGILLGTYLVKYYMQLNLVRDRAGRKLVGVKSEIVSVGKPCAPLLTDLMILDAVEVTLEGKKRQMRIDDVTRQDCSDMLERMGAGSVDALLKVLSREDIGMKARRMLALTLGGTRQKKAYAPLVKMLRKDPAWQVRADAAIALGKLGDRRAVSPLTDAVQKDDDRFVVKKAGEARYRLLNGTRRG